MRITAYSITASCAASVLILQYLTLKHAVPNHHIIQPTNDKFRAGRRLLADTMTTGFLNKARHDLHVINSNPLRLTFGSNRSQQSRFTGIYSI